MAVYDNMAYETPMSEPDTYFGEKMSMETMSYEKPLPTPPADDICFEDKLNEAEFTFALQNSKAATLVSDSTSPIVAVIGVGYVGFELVQAFGRAYPVIAFDVSRKRILDVQQQLGHRPSIICTSDPSQLDGATHFLIAVPTNLLPNRNVDESALRKALLTITPYVRPGAVVMIESSVAVGMTRRLLKPLMRSKGAKGGMSPERVDPGRTNPPNYLIPKIISGLDDITPLSSHSIHALYTRVFPNLIRVSRPEVAEMTKLYENGQRMMCIAYANEMADACVAHGIDPQEVSSAASTKPFGYMPYWPSLGVGGHCIPVNPYYLLSNNSFPLLEAATTSMWERPARVGDRAMQSLMESSQYERRGSAGVKVLVVGVGFKRGQAVLSNSPGVALMQHLLERWDAYVEWADPLVEEDAVPFAPKFDEATQWNEQGLARFDLIIVAMNQVGLDFDVLQKVGVKVEYTCRMD